MNTSELMIGDWVRLKTDIDTEYYVDHVVPGQVIRVTEILDNSINPRWCSAEVGDAILDSDIEPVPLTWETLLKSGFIEKHPESAKRTYLKDPLNRIIVHKNRGVPYFEITGNPKEFGWFCPRFQGHVYHVHELQHILRACRIDMEISL